MTSRKTDFSGLPDSLLSGDQPGDGFVFTSQRLVARVARAARENATQDWTKAKLESTLADVSRNGVPDKASARWPLYQACKGELEDRVRVHVGRITHVQV